jgi:hypothetical protein
MSDKVCKPERMNVERIGARGFTILGGIFWTVAAFSGPFSYDGATLAGAFGVAIYPLIFTIATLAFGWFYERSAGVLLGVAALGTIGWGFIMGWEPFVWGIMLLFFVTPTVIAAVLFYLAGSMAQVCSVSEAPTHAGLTS